MWPNARGRVLAFVPLVIAIASGTASAYPGSVRWGYGNCGTCHYNVAGGGLLTPYGRQLSRELLSTWGDESEAEFAYGSLKLPTWLALGGDLTYLATSGAGASNAQGNSFRLLQADMEAAVTRGRFLAVAAAGRRPNASGYAGDGWLSRRHYLQVNATPMLSFRAGRFLPTYGVWNGTASVATRRGLGWDRDSYNVEANWISEHLNASVTGIFSGNGGWPSEPGVAASAGFFFANQHKVGLSVLSRGRPGQERRAAGLSGSFGLGKRWFLLTQTDLQKIRNDDLSIDSRKDLYANVCVSWEAVKGLYVMAIDEMARTDLGRPGRLSHSYGSALRWFPRPHLELQVRWRNQDRTAVSPQYLDGLSALVHFYP